MMSRTPKEAKNDLSRIFTFLGLSKRYLFEFGFRISDFGIWILEFGLGFESPSSRFPVYGFLLSLVIVVPLAQMPTFPRGVGPIMGGC